MLSTWLSYGDVCRLVIAAASAVDVGCDVVWGASANSRTFWRRDARAKIGWTPQDSADTREAELLGKKSDNPLAERYQGGIDTTRG
jgi:uronate dehydrogenase